MTKLNYESLEPIFHPRSIALAGITVNNPEHWTRTFLNSLLRFDFQGAIYLINPAGGEIGGIKVYTDIDAIPDSIDYVISTVPARAASQLIEECADKKMKAIHFCTAGFSETGEEEGIRLETELVELSRSKGIRILGPNCMGIYCPQSRLSFHEGFPRESGSVGFISQSGGNAIALVRGAMWRGVRFSKVISYGNACDLDESDFLEYLTADPDTKIIALYIEGIKDGKRFRQALGKAAKLKPVVLLKGGVTQGGARAAASHTGALVGDEVIWDSLCKQLGVIRACSFEELTDLLVTLLFLPIPDGKSAALIGAGGGASVLVADDFEKRGLSVPPLPQKIRGQIREFTSAAGNILRNPVDYSQAILEPEMLVKTVSIIAQWEGCDFIVGFFRPSQSPQRGSMKMFEIVQDMYRASRAASKPMALVYIPSTSPKQAKDDFTLITEIASLQLPIYSSFASAANAIDLVLSHSERRFDKSC